MPVKRWPVSDPHGSFSHQPTRVGLLWLSKAYWSHKAVKKLSWVDSSGPGIVPEYRFVLKGRISKAPSPVLLPFSSLVGRLGKVASSCRHETSTKHRKGLHSWRNLAVLRDLPIRQEHELLKRKHGTSGFSKLAGLLLRSHDSSSFEAYRSGPETHTWKFESMSAAKRPWSQHRSLSQLCTVFEQLDSGLFGLASKPNPRCSRFIHSIAKSL